MSRVWIFDTTLRDGAQTQGVDFSVGDKIAIAEALDALGIDYIEGGWPGANPTDDQFFAACPALTQARLTAFGMTRRAETSAANDPGLNALLNAGAPVLCLVGKSWDWQVDVALGIPREENLLMIAESLQEVRRRGREAQFDAEHFFDGYRANPAYALACINAAAEAGARWITLCDTNGGTLPDDVARITAHVVAELGGGERLGIHTHDDAGCAVANTLAAVRAGARLVQGTLNGLGERCGNANLTTLLPALMLKLDLETGVPPERLRQLTPVSRLLDERLNRSPLDSAPYVGARAFAHKGGLHVSAIARDPRTYEHVDPEAVGNRRQVLVSDQAGRSNLLARLKDLGIAVAPEDPRLRILLDLIKGREAEGYAYEGASGSFELLARQVLGVVPERFRLDRFHVTIENRVNGQGRRETLAEAVVKLALLDGAPVMTVGEGNGPVDALDEALRKALQPVFPVLAQLELSDFKVRILDPGSGTAAVTRVLVEWRELDRGRRWATVGVSANIIEASWIAIAEAMTLFLLHRQPA